MTLKQSAGRLVGALIAIFVVTMFVGQMLGQPVLLSFVKTGSMAPTLQPGDGFIAIPAALAGEIERGDVITFKAETLHGGGLTTHRVVRKTEQGYITKGDANPTTDQSGNEPPVTEGQIKAKAFELGDNIVVIPKVGLLALFIRDFVSSFQRTLATTLGTRRVLGTQGFSYIFAAFGILVYAGEALLGNSGGRQRERDVKRDTNEFNVSLVVVGLTVVLIILLTSAMIVPGGAQEFSFVSSQTEGKGPSIIKSGETENITYKVPSTGAIPTMVFLEPQSTGLTVTPRQMYVDGGETKRAILRLKAPEKIGVYNRYVVEHRYLAVLPSSVIERLYRIHPWVPILVIDALFGVGFMTLGFAVVGRGVVRKRSRSQKRSLVDRIRQWLL